MEEELSLNERTDTYQVLTDKEITEKSKATTSVLKRISDDGKEINLDNLSPTEIEKYNKLNSSLNIKDINSVANFGSELQNTMTKYSNQFLEATRASKSGEIGELINNLLSELNYVDIEELEDKSSFKAFMRKIPIINKLFTSVEKVIAKYDTIGSNVEAITQKILAMRIASMRDNTLLQTMFNNNIAYGTQIDELIIAGKIKCNEINEKLNDMIQHSEQYEAHEIQDIQNFKHNLERRLHDMLVLRYVIKQSLPQIRIVQYNNLSIADKAQTLISTTIPSWRIQLSIALALYKQKTRIEAQKKISDTTNQILLKNAQLLKENSIDIARENERSIVDIETLKTTTRNLIETIKEVKEIHEKAETERAVQEEEIKRIESELESAMTSMIKR